ncbi:sugar ABC transporter ATP-binding protein [Leucobacter manosquensis]|uniref:Sugar ABC transporter ATP-binding protein n=1 Tax=Leucobacter manosquensis TaxID=2810611 RepID=A0ABS5M6U6_9MICO|nr:sugar ABC transporter ATP-binding protein [Leucobacter manosquensis]MBS3182932.1 sugar ABC transporter ATP-binding protein [Leucobacter manosquensis]
MSVHEAPAPAPTAATGAPVLSVIDIRKQFFGNEVLHGISLDLVPGTVHGLVGENGAGKSTLMKIVAGVYRRDGGDVRLDGASVDFGHPVEAAAAGVATVFQEFNLLSDRSVAQNVFLGREPRRSGLIDTAAMRRATADLLDDLGIAGIDPGSQVGSLTVAEQQIVEIVKALSVDARVISMDEPTAALADHEVAILYRVIRRLRDRGVAILYVSHRLKEIFDLCDTITVMKDGSLVSSDPVRALDQPTLVRRMVGRPISAYFPDPVPGTAPGEVVVHVRDGGNTQLDGIDLDVRAGEVVGLSGLQGSGRTELVEAIFGAAPFTRGTLKIAGSARAIRSPRQAVRLGIALVTEDRKRTGLALNQSILDNALLAIRSVFPRRTRRERATIPGVFESLELVSRGPKQEVQALSGGNQQKVVLAKWLATEPRVVLLDEPTRGIDVGAKVAVYRLIRDLAKRGVAILLVSSELPEVIGMADRILVMRDGRIAGELPAGSSEETVLALATGAVEAGGAA